MLASIYHTTGSYGWMIAPTNNILQWHRHAQLLTQKRLQIRRLGGLGPTEGIGEIWISPYKNWKTLGGLDGVRRVSWDCNQVDMIWVCPRLAKNHSSRREKNMESRWYSLGGSWPHSQTGPSGRENSGLVSRKPSIFTPKQFVLVFLRVRVWVGQCVKNSGLTTGTIAPVSRYLPSIYPDSEG